MLITDLRVVNQDEGGGANSLITQGPRAPPINKASGTQTGIQGPTIYHSSYYGDQFTPGKSHLGPAISITQKARILQTSSPDLMVLLTSPPPLENGFPAITSYHLP